MLTSEYWCVVPATAGLFSQLKTTLLTGEALRPSVAGAGAAATSREPAVRAVRTDVSMTSDMLSSCSRDYGMRTCRVYEFGFLFDYIASPRCSLLDFLADMHPGAEKVRDEDDIPQVAIEGSGTRHLVANRE